jgi:hypothetical protein
VRLLFHRIKPDLGYVKRFLMRDSYNDEICPGFVDRSFVQKKLKTPFLRYRTWEKGGV